MSEFTPTRRENPCPICEDTSGKCELCELDGMCLCQTKIDAEEGDLVGTWKCEKPFSDDSIVWMDQGDPEQYIEIEISLNVTLLTVETHLFFQENSPASCKKGVRADG